MNNLMKALDVKIQVVYTVKLNRTAKSCGSAGLHPPKASNNSAKFFVAAGAGRERMRL